MNFSKFARRNYLQDDTPIEKLHNLSEALGGDVNIYVKRDDLLPGAGGGNKTRKLEFCMADALKQGADSIITCGAIQSNHCRLTASWSCKENLDCHLVLEERVKGSYNPENNGNNFLFELLDVKNIRVVPGGSDLPAEMNKTAEELKSEGKTPYIISEGASNAIGALGYAACAQEMMGQLNSRHLNIDQVILPSGSAGTHAGMVVGLVGTNSDIPVSGINVSRSKADQEAIVLKLAKETADKLKVKNSITKDEIECFDQYVGPGYSLPTESMVEAVKYFARYEAILLDPVYSGKAAAGLIDLIRKEHFPAGSNVLFLHTGGSPALYAYTDTFRQ